MTEAGSRAAWEDVTTSTPLTYHQGTVQFNTVVSAAFWLVNLPTWMVEDSVGMLDKLYRWGNRWHGIDYFDKIDNFTDNFVTVA